MKIVTETIINGGTDILSFVYDGKVRNVLFGSNRAAYYPKWGNHINCILTEHNGKLYISGIDNNDHHRVKTFDVSKIEFQD